MTSTTLHTILTGALADHASVPALCTGPECWCHTAAAELTRFRRCLRCGHLWQTDGQPKTCAGCRSPYWDKERTR